MKSILDPTFVYIPSACTDIRKTFARVREAQSKTVGRTLTVSPRLLEGMKIAVLKK